MSKSSKITSLIVIPLIASAIFLANPTFAKNQNRLELSKQAGNVTNLKERPRSKKHITGDVTSISGSTIIVTTKSGEKYTVETGNATIMQELGENNPAIINIAQIKVGDSIVVRGKINDTAINAESISSGDLKLEKSLKMKREDSLKNKMLLKKKLKER